MTKFTFTLPEKDLSDRMKLLMSNCVGGAEVNVLTDSTGRTRNVKHPVSSKKGMCNLSAQKAKIWHGNILEFCALFDLRPHWILPQTLSMRLSIYRIYLYGKCHMHLYIEPICIHDVALYKEFLRSHNLTITLRMGLS